MASAPWAGGVPGVVGPCCDMPGSPSVRGRVPRRPRAGAGARNARRTRPDRRPTVHRTGIVETASFAERPRASSAIAASIDLQALALGDQHALDAAVARGLLRPD